ncbi:hypothetical protein B0H14DRAFT_2560142 [Mycena olivaceomarginata]|nr:hypothetical protein B0H14DRAFT_2560142 [Mycena olivaceomarginata]
MWTLNQFYYQFFKDPHGLGNSTKQARFGASILLKYRKENCLPETVTSFSPASTSSELQEELCNLPTADAQMRHVLAYYPHHYTGFEHKPRNDEERQMILSESWKDVIDTLRVNKTPEISPKRETESLKETNPHSVREGKRRAQLQDEEEETSEYPLMSSGTPYRRAADFMMQWTCPEGRSVSQAPSAKQDPNVFRNLASGPIGGIGSQYRQTFGADTYINLRARGAQMGKGQASAKGGTALILPQPSNPLDIYSFAQTSSRTAGHLAHAATSTLKWSNNGADTTVTPTFAGNNQYPSSSASRLGILPPLQEADLRKGQAEMPATILLSHWAPQDCHTPPADMEEGVEGMEELLIQEEEMETAAAAHPDQEEEVEDGLHNEDLWDQEAPKIFQAWRTWGSRSSWTSWRQWGCSPRP